MDAVATPGPKETGISWNYQDENTTTSTDVTAAAAARHEKLSKCAITMLTITSVGLMSSFCIFAPVCQIAYLSGGSKLRLIKGTY